MLGYSCTGTPLGGVKATINQTQVRKVYTMKRSEDGIKPLGYLARQQPRAAGMTRVPSTASVGCQGVAACHSRSAFRVLRRCPPKQTLVGSAGTNATFSLLGRQPRQGSAPTQGDIMDDPLAMEPSGEKKISRRRMRLFLVEHEGKWLGGNTLVVTSVKGAANRMARKAMREHGLKDHKITEVTEIDISKPGAYVVNDGDY